MMVTNGSHLGKGEKCVMIKKKIVNLTKSVMAGFLAMAMIVSGIVMIPTSADAADTADTVCYLSGYDITQYWKEDVAERTAPVLEGHVFGGWYATADSTTPLTEETAKSATTAYAKFVPNYVLSVKAQNEEGTAEGVGPKSVRILSSVDCKRYKNVGFDILLNNSKSIGTCETTNVYGGLKNSAESTDVKYPEEEFGTLSDFFSVWRLDNINHKNYGKIIYVRPYWTTLDGTKVYGLAKYVHMEDEYNNYINVPVNLFTGEDVAAGTVDMSYSTNLDFVSFEAGRVLPEMKENSATAGTIKMVGNATTVDTSVKADGIYATVRFKAKENADVSNLTFSMNNIKFCNWKEEFINTVKVLNVTCE